MKIRRASSSEIVEIIRRFENNPELLKDVFGDGAHSIGMDISEDGIGLEVEVLGHEDDVSIPITIRYFNSRPEAQGE